MIINTYIGIKNNEYELKNIYDYIQINNIKHIKNIELNRLLLNTIKQLIDKIISDKMPKLIQLVADSNKATEENILRKHGQDRRTIFHFGDDLDKILELINEIKLFYEDNNNNNKYNVKYYKRLINILDNIDRLKTKKKIISFNIKNINLGDNNDK